MSPAQAIETELAVFCDDWSLPASRHFFESKKLKTQIFARKTAETPKLIFAGNGETFRKAQLIFGKPLASEIWNLSLENYRVAQRFLKTMEVPFQYDGEEVDKALLFEAPEKGHFTHWKTFFKKDKRYELVFMDGEKEIRVTSHGVLFLTEVLPPEFLVSMKDEWLPATMSSFTFKATEKDFSALFHLGSDYVYALNGTLVAGSYRNLFADKGFGHNQKVDPVSEKALKAFVAQKWPGATYASSHIHWEAISCDGLPIVGGLSDLPGVYMACCFGGKPQNFVFGLCQKLADGILQGTGYKETALFSPTRFL